MNTCKCCFNNLQLIDIIKKTEICIVCNEKKKTLYKDNPYLNDNYDNKIKKIESSAIKQKYIDILNCVNDVNNINGVNIETLSEIPTHIFPKIKNKKQENLLLSINIEIVYSFYKTYDPTTQSFFKKIYEINYPKYITSLNLILLKKYMKANFILLTNIIEYIKNSHCMDTDKIYKLYLENKDNTSKYLEIIYKEIKDKQTLNYINLNRKKIIQFGLNSPIVEIINHPSSLSYFQIDTIKILVLGEVHRLRNTKYYDNYSLDFSSYINQMIDYDVCFDLFIEDKLSKILTRQVGGEEDFNQVGGHLYDILLGEVPINENNINLRYHTWDIRTININGVDSDLFSEYEKLDTFILQRKEFIPIDNFIEVFITEYIKCLFDLKYTVDYINEIINEIKELNPEINVELFFKHFSIVRNLINKQIIKSRISELSGKSIIFIQNLLIDIYVKLQLTDLDFIHGLLPDSYTRNHTNFSKNIRDSRLGFIGLITTDIYLLFRVFAEFNNKMDRLNNPIKCDEEYLHPKNIIVYGGSTHTDVFNYMVKHIFDIEPLIELRNNYNNSYVELDNPVIFF